MTQASDFTRNLDLHSSLILFYTERFSVLAASETCYAGQLVPLNTVTETTQARGHSRYAVNARQLTAPLRTLLLVRIKPNRNGALVDEGDAHVGAEDTRFHVTARCG